MELFDKKIIREVLSIMTENTQENINIIKEYFVDINIRDGFYQSTLLHAFVDENFEMFGDKIIYGVQTLLENGIDPNALDFNGDNFIQLAVKQSCNSIYIYNILREALKYGFDINCVNDENQTIFHLLIQNEEFTESINSIYELACENGFDILITDKNDETVALVLKRLKIESVLRKEKNPVEKISDFAIREFDKIHDKELDKICKKEKTKIKTEYKIDEVLTENLREVLTDKEKNTLNKHGYILNKKEYTHSPTIGREKEIENLMIMLAMKNKSVLIVGESGIGKTALAEELVYRIKNNMVPHFLKEQIIYEISANGMVAGTKYVGELEKKFKEIMEICCKKNIIVFIDEIHTIYGAGKSETNDNDMASILRFYIDRKNLKVIGTTTEYEYDKYFSESSLKRRFKKLVIQEPKENILKQITKKLIIDYCKEDNISVANLLEKYPQIIDIIIKFTRKNYRDYKDRVNNPDLIQMIIDNAFAYAKYKNDKELNLEHLKKGFEEDRLYPIAQKEAIKELDSLSEVKERESGKILKIDFYKSKI